MTLSARDSIVFAVQQMKILFCQKLAACLCMKEPPPVLSKKSENAAAGDSSACSPGDEEDQGFDADDKEEKTQHDWLFAAAVLNRICSIAFAFVFFGGTFIFVMLFSFHP